MVLDGDTTHAPDYPALLAPELARSRREGMRWYGDEERVAQWLPWLVRVLEETQK